LERGGHALVEDPLVTGRIQPVVATLDEGGLRWAGQKDGRRS
jgi:hypothetical protein